MVAFVRCQTLIELRDPEKSGLVRRSKAFDG